MRPFLSTFVIAVTALLPIASEAEPQHIYIEQFSCETGPFSLRLPQKLPKLMKLGMVKHQTINTVEKWDGYTTTDRTVFFPDLTIGLVTFSNDSNRYMLSFVEIAGSQWSSIAPFQIGELVSSVREKLGKPASGDSNLGATYAGDAETISFLKAHRRITKITYQCYTG